MDVIDLTLAINYLPACACVAKTCGLALCLCAIQAARVFPAYAVAGGALMADRLLYPARIMDCNSVLLSVFAAHLVWEAQRASEGRWEPWSGAPILLSLLWASQAGWCLWGGHIAANSILRQYNHQIAFAEAMLLAGLSAFLHAEEEMRIVRFSRYLTFASLSLCWMYVLGLYRRRLMHAADSGVHFAIYFSPVLYGHQYAALLYSAFCLVSITMHLRAPSPHPSAAPTPAGPCEAPCAPYAPYEAAEPCYPAAEAAADDMEELERVYRMALGGKGSV